MASMGSSCVSLLVLLLLQGEFAVAEVNVYGQPMTDCGSSHAAGCTYAAMDAGAHQVCVTQLPAGFSSKTGQGPWSDQFTGQPWCICIWAYSNYVLHQANDLPLKCDSIPAKVLEGQYSLDKFKECGSMASISGCGPEDIRRSIQSLCQQCDAQAADPTSKTTLKTKCDAILASAPAAPMQRLYEAGVVSASDESPSNTISTHFQLSHGASSMLAIGFCAFAMMAAGLWTVRRRRVAATDESESLESQPGARSPLE